MKFLTLAAAVLALAFPAFAQPLIAVEELTYDTIYDDASLSLDVVACSNGVNGLITKGYTTLGSLPTFPNIGGVYTVTGWNSTSCGTCYNVTYGDVTISILAVDTCGYGFNVAEEAMNTLTDGKATELGIIEVTSIEVDVSYCKL